MNNDFFRCSELGQIYLALKEEGMIVCNNFIKIIYII